ncbi:MAG: DUF1295 domain-containing protein [Deltaproteobacteria bacterium]|nr:DUF1295 domain-containing protein [Deltaproteobacteria bacterium]
MGLAAATFILLFFISAPYGRHTRKGWGPQIPARLGWILMEAPSPLLMGALFLLGSHKSAASIAFLVLWEAHYLHRAFLYPFTLSNPRPVPVSITFFGACFNFVNASINGYFLFFLADHPASWLADPRFVAGTALFAAGFVVNRWADLLLRGLRAPGETGYKIPRGGPWELVSSPNYLGEILQWCAWALLTWSLAGASFAVWTIANLAPRAVTNHRWYRERFPDYPPARRALIPFLW